jgi:hypothetical protein
MHKIGVVKEHARYKFDNKRNKFWRETDAAVIRKITKFIEALCEHGRKEIRAKLI